jgi:hypothetical protein
VFHEQLERLFSKETIIDLDRPPFELLKQNKIENGTYFFVNDKVSFGKAELDLLLDWTAKGNNLFIASSNFEDKLLDTLNLSTSTVSNFNNSNAYLFQLKSEMLKNDSTYTFDKAYYFQYFNEIDSLNTKTISIIDKSNDSLHINNQNINTIKQPFGKGSIILSTFPQAFTNYFILNSPNNNYTAGLASYLDASKPIYFDNYYKSGKSFYSSPLYIFLKTKELKWAYYLLLIGTVFYVIFEGKRKQRAIPIVNPLKNQTVNFTRTIANMYYEKGKHKEIAEHKIQHFLDFIRTQLHLGTNTVSDVFLKNLAARSNNTFEDTQHLFKTIERFQNKTKLDTNELEKLNTLIETFKSKNTWTTKT